jgi:hypothetical protein
MSDQPEQHKRVKSSSTVTGIDPSVTSGTLVLDSPLPSRLRRVRAVLTARLIAAKQLRDNHSLVVLLSFLLIVTWIGWLLLFRRT